MLTALLAASLSAAPPACTLRSAEPATVRELAAAPEKWLGRCVRLEGFTTGYTFYQDVAGTYRYDASDRDRRPNDGWLGLYFRQGRDHRRGMRRATVAGIVHDCERDYESAAATAGPNEIIMPVGYCHYRGGLILLDATVRHGDLFAPFRATGERARLDYGDLRTVDEAGSPPEPVVRLVRLFAAAVRSGDSGRAAALAQSYNRNVGEDPASRARWHDFLIGGGPFAFLRKSRREEAVWFHTRLSLYDVKYREPGTWFACFCATSDCERSWPISARDAAADADPAYSCVRVYRQPGETTWQLGIDTRKDWGFAARD